MFEEVSLEQMLEAYEGRLAAEENPFEDDGYDRHSFEKIPDEGKDLYQTFTKQYHILLKQGFASIFID